MAGKTVSFNTHCNLSESQVESVARWLSCNGEVWGMGPTAVFASAAALFLYNELQATIFVAGDHAHVSLLEKTLVCSMVAGMLALMIHLWVCSMRFFQYYLDTLIRDSPNILLEMTTAGFLGQTEMVPLGPLTRFLKQQQPQIHITICWFLSLCYADYVRKHYCQRFNMPYLEQWQAELHARASRGVHHTIQKVNSFVGAVHQRLRGYTQAVDVHTLSSTCLRRILEFFGHIARKRGDNLEKALITGRLEGKRPRGRSPMRWTDQVKSSALINISEAIHIAEDRDKWREISAGGRVSREASAAGSRVSFASAARAASGTRADGGRPDRVVGARLISQASETTADVLEKLRAYVSKTRCPCTNSAQEGLARADASADNHDPTHL
ncbi:uncharacterized protein LOC119830903 [Zerene cesonia]|uniref:uncharacterized protein LOC119830903 n=1 Tax=Zerene cesonia TaxID=33412 RepID=UPI0018E4DD1B|nr:uncharacterized protein LOC119830903 [Zerene cesonia]